MGFDEHYAFRRGLVDALKRDLVGPAEGESEIIDDAPITRYASGILFPRDAGMLEPSEDIETAEEDGEVAPADPPVALANRRYPSSMGMTFAVDSEAASRITVRVGAARYIRLQVERRAGDRDSHRRTRRRGNAVEQWRRCPLATRTFELDVAQPVADHRESVGEGLELFWRVRPRDASGAVPVTLVLLNTQRAGFTPGERDAKCFFQPYIEADSDAPDGAPFVERPAVGALGSDEDVRGYRLLYRHAREFAVGHGCSVRWEPALSRDDRAASIATTFVPEYELAIADSNPAIESPAMVMRHLVHGERGAVVRDLLALCDGYDRWIGERAEELEGLAPELREVAGLHLDRCREALRRMRQGADLLQTDRQAWQAFRLANRAMLQQRARTVWLQGGRPVPEPVEDERHQWRPFQIAFILLCLKGISEASSVDRELVDLLWFPTGGGKTEAYLGLTAFTVFLRRLRQPANGGVTALMRYTLRLLTVQQFERASLLICCSEAIRAAHPDLLGTEPISIGLWVGQSATPNNRAQARDSLNKLRRGATLTEMQPVQLHACPWCGAPLDHTNYHLGTDPARLRISCGQPGCRFEDGLPVYVVDEDIYDYRPTLIIATVDKFASLPWRQQAASLFNIGPDGRPVQAPPELIIQDELHLISGPLGTLVGLYETSVDLLCSSGGVRPKVIASTATIRRAQDQAHNLFNRDVRQFPPPGLDARDSHFSVEAPAEDRGTRMYVGLMAPGTSHTTLLIRAYAALLQKAADHPGSPEVKDPYWTLVGYFNSLRVLGGARMQVQDDVTDRVSLLSTHAGTEKRLFEKRIELTSREPSGNIPEYLRAMAVALPAQEALDVILATNMISVGMDIDRLGLMVVMGQPQATSEYIQSTSRVGRKWPGLVVVLFNAARSRDRSHYESFVAYHAALYRQVEATSVTPFSARARDRALHAVLIALARQLAPAFRPNSGAAAAATRRAELEELSSLILDRVRDVAAEELPAAKSQLDEIIERWQGRASRNPGLVFSNWRDPSKALLINAGDDSPTEDVSDYFPTLWSLRDVDRDSALQLVDLEDR